MDDPDAGTDPDPDARDERDGADARDATDGPLAAHRRPTRVREVYDDIATHFAETRHHPWPDVKRFVGECRPCERGLDVGCGNGRHAALLAGVADRVIGLDLSRGLLAECRDRTDGVALVQGDAAAIPVGGGTVDVALSVATIHHLPDREARRRSLAEIDRVLASGGRALISAWSTAHDRFDADGGDDGFDTTVDWTLPGGETVPRFYHIYAPAEFAADLAASPLAVERTFLSSGNCYAEVRAE
jgi:ubiquinone/menaquinone biosynthesis C-methylase UbiE